MSPIDKARECVYNYACKHLCPTDDAQFTMDDVYVVLFAYVLGGWKALVSTTLPDGMYYEVTRDITNNRTYVDAYKRFDQEVIDP